MGTLHEDQYTFLVISRSVLLRSVSDNRCREKNYILYSITFVRKSCRLWSNVEKCCTAGRANCVLLPKVTNAHSE